MKRDQSEGGAVPDQITNMAMDLAGVVADRSQLNLELLTALAASVDRNERVQEKFRNAVVRKLARLEARARVLQISEIVDSLKFGPLAPAVEQEAGFEAMVTELSGELGRKMFKGISGGRDERSGSAPR